MQPITQEDKRILLDLREKSEKEAGSYKELKKLREERDAYRKSVNDAKKNDNYESLIDKYARLANKRVSEYIADGGKAADIALFIVKAPFILFDIAAVGLFIFFIIVQIVTWKNYGDLERILIVVAIFFMTPIYFALVGLVNSIGNLIGAILHAIVWEIYSKIANFLPGIYFKKYMKIHLRGYTEARWKYQSKLFNLNREYSQNEVVRFTEKDLDQSFWDKHEACWECYLNDMMFVGHTGD